MSVLIGIALKSLLIGGLTLGLLQLMRKRSAAERSWVAHIGLLALVIIAFAPLVLPTLPVEAPAMFGRTEAAVASQPASIVANTSPVAAVTAVPLPAAAKAAPGRLSIDPIAAMTAAYAIPAAILLLITFIAL